LISFRLNFALLTMQSGISASPALLSAFSSYTSTPLLFALPITIQSETLHPLEAIPFTSHDFSKDLSSLAPHLQANVPIYLILRRNPSDEKFTCVSYVPGTAPVRSKTLFASTRSTLVRELGLERFDGQVFATEKEEILDFKQWEERDGRGGSHYGAGKGLKSDSVEQRLELLSVEERELEGIKRAEMEERHGTQGRQMVGMGSGDPSRSGTPSSGVRMKSTDEVKAALGQIGKGEGDNLVMLGIDVATETLVLVKHEEAGVEDVAKSIPSDRPTYSFYRHAGGEQALFLYVCPGASKVKERMLYAASRQGVLAIAAEQGVKVMKRLEASDPDELSGSRLAEEAGGKDDAAADADTGASKAAFARPKRPGRR
jgi:twinfilin